MNFFQGMSKGRVNVMVNLGSWEPTKKKLYSYIHMSATAIPEINIVFFMQTLLRV